MSAARRKGVGHLLWICVPILLLLLIAAFLWFVLFPEWQLHHTYERQVTGGKPDVFYNHSLLERHKSRVRQWIANDLLRSSRLRGELSPSRAKGQMHLLSQFGEQADLDILLKRAEIGFPIEPDPPGVVRDMGDPAGAQQGLCVCLVETIHYVCEKVRGEGKGIQLLEEELDHSKIAPEVLKIYQELKTGGFLEQR